MECKERQRLLEAYFDAFKRQRRISESMAAIRDAGEPRLIEVAEAQERAALDETYEAWQALNQHSCSAQCKRAT
jgi:hypothetical protein